MIYLRLLEIADKVVDDAEIPDELLYGRSGYLYALLFVRHYISQQTVSDAVVARVNLNVCLAYCSNVCKGLLSKE